jgi:SseB protein C-terminal domain
MSRFNSTSKKNPEEFRVPQLQFLGEQDGPPERELKFRLAQFFQSDQSVTTAYLARVAYGGESFAVALCLRARFGFDRGLAEELGKIFASIFGSHEHLDIIFLSEAQQSELAIVCKPFFQVGEKEPDDGGVQRHN